MAKESSGAVNAGNESLEGQKYGQGDFRRAEVWPMTS